MNIRLITHEQLLKIKKLIDWNISEGKNVPFYLIHSIGEKVEENNMMRNITGESSLINFTDAEKLFDLMPKTTQEWSDFREFGH